MEAEGEGGKEGKKRSRGVNKAPKVGKIISEVTRLTRTRRQMTRTSNEPAGKGQGKWGGGAKGGGEAEGRIRTYF